MKNDNADAYFKEKFKEAQNYKNLGKLNEALRLFTELKNETPNDFVVHIALGLTNKELGNIVAALDNYKEAIKYGPNSEKLSLLYFHLLWDNDMVSEAFDEMRRFLKENKSDEYTRILNEMTDED